MYEFMISSQILLKQRFTCTHAHIAIEFFPISYN
jgi:hypothetical protein